MVCAHVMCTVYSMLRVITLSAVLMQALIWSRKSTGLPIEIRTAYSSSGDAAPPAEMSYCKLDIDIYKVGSITILVD